MSPGFHQPKAPRTVKLFACPVCANTLYFENWQCERCHARLGYLPHRNEMAAADGGAGNWRTAAAPANNAAACANASHFVCNWLVVEDDRGPFCQACRHNGVIPLLSGPRNRDAWALIEVAKRRLFYSLLRWQLPLPTRKDNPHSGLRFEFLADGPGSGPR